MNRKNLLLSVTVLIVLTLVSLLPVSSMAAQDGRVLYLGITELRTNDTPNIGYAIGNPSGNGVEGSGAKIWNIQEHTGPNDGNPVKADGNKNIYCVKAGVGFSNTHRTATYNIFYDMKTERNTIASNVSPMESVVNGTIPTDSGSVNAYDALLALSDMLYLIDDENDESVKEAYLEAANITTDSWNVLLTRDDIAAVQQAAIWYFTNYDEIVDGERKYDKTDDVAWLNYTTDGSTYTSLSAYNASTEEGRQRQEQAEILYKYLINTAIENASNYSGSGTTSTEAPAKVNTTTLNYEESNGKYIIGPINITENSKAPYTIDLTVKNGETEVNNYTLLNSRKQEVEEGTTVKDLVGQDFYISVDTDDVSTISLEIDINYSSNTLTLWTSANNNEEQPVMIPEKKPESQKVELEVTPDEKIFDLALRKYITQVNGNNVNNSRVPNIDESTLQSGTTATYNHRKDPVVVETGDLVTYNITIYNEGEKDGRATKIVDQLPTGLKFNRVISGNFQMESYDEDGDNRLTLVRNAGNENNLPAYTGTGDPSSETITIECEVVAKPDEVDTTILTNVAWISEEYDAEDDVTITNQDGADRDSEPATTPDVNKDNMSNYTGNGNKNDLTDSNYYYKGQQDDDDFEKLVLMPESFDLKLIKRITQVNGQNVPERIESVDVSDLNTIGEDGQLITTGDYNLSKEPVEVKQGDIVTYTFRIYNEGTIDGYASEITEDIPDGLEFLWSELEGEDLQNDPNLTDEEKEAIEFNQNYLWGNFQYDESGERIIQISTDYLSKENETTVDGNLIPAFGSNDGTKTEDDISYKEVSVKLKVISNNVSGEVIRNEAAITEDTDENGDPVDDRDSDTEEWVKYEDDEDYDNIILQSFDLALRKFIVAVSNDETVDDEEYLRNEDGSYTRAPVVDTTFLNTAKSFITQLPDGTTQTGSSVCTTATYNHTKEPVEVQMNDYVVYMLRVYNEGEMAGYAAEIKDHLPPYLEFVDNEFNREYGWSVSEDGRTVTTRYLENSLIDGAEQNDEGTYVLSYVDVPIMCRVVDSAPTGENITNIADITEYQDENKEPVVDRDSEEDNVNLPSDEELPGYKDDETGDYIPGQEDDDDFEKVIIKEFDLALRKFITQVEDEEITNRIPNLSYDETTGEITYNHTKDPVQLVSGNVVIYTIRVYNEGEIAGYASEITDDIPDGLEFLPDNETNINYRWVMYDENGNVTENVEEAVSVKTVYLSKDNEETEGENLLDAFNPDEPISDTNPDYKDVQIAFRVIEPNESDRILVNSAQISEDTDEDGNPVDDKDSIPDEWNDGEDDQDKEYVELLYFDLSLRKWVTQAIVIDKDGNQEITETGHEPYDDPEQIVKVDLYRKNINDVTVKFRYKIRVTNEGEIAGYAKEITDYVPEGLRFLPEDNPGWTDEGNNVISTRLLENTLLQPGEYAEVEVVLTWINNEDNMGLKENTAEISEDYNDYDVPDRDSTPDNQEKGEDDIDDAPVMLSVSTGQVRIYFTLGFVVLITIAGGILLIKKFIL